MDNNASVPYFVVESLINMHRKQMTHMVIIFVICIITMTIGFLYAWTSYDYESSETVTKTTTVQQDGSGVNVYGSDNEVSNGTENNDNPYQNES